MTDIWLVRHGEAAASFDQEIDPGLSPLGHEQAEAASQQLSAIVPLDAQLWSSPKQRALQTGAPFAGVRDVVLQQDARFIELPSPKGLAQRSEWLQQALASDWSALPTAVHEWRDSTFAALQALSTPTVIFTHFLVINSIAAAVSHEDAVVQCLPANGSIHHLQIDGPLWHWVSRGAMLESIVN
ncbi:histidine phosphatase family protein [Luminiphilus sp.]|nr:histidine phosphatase family protein [Luminiphilus sp.]